MVDRCVCRGITFAEILLRWPEATFEEVSARTGCGASCGLCAPYIREALRTGKGSLPVMDVGPGEGRAEREKRGSGC